MLVSFDFDDTLLLTRPDEDWGLVEAGPNEPMLAALWAHHEAGDTIIIVTSRHERHELPKPQTFMRLKDIPPPRTPVCVFVAKHKLPVKEIHFTNGEDKVVTLERLGVNKHFDDDEDELALLPGDIEGVLAPIHPEWAQVL